MQKFTCLLAALTLSACANGGDNANAGGSGGTATPQGGASSGGASSSNGGSLVPSGGVVTTGGIVGLGGAFAQGGSNGGTLVTGGAVASGGASTQGGSTTGGALTTGGVVGLGGTSAQGGSTTGGALTTGGAKSSGGSSNSTGGTPATGGSAAGGAGTGGAGGTSGAAGMRNITSAQLVKEMKAGWNLGNTLDAPTETGWGNPQTTQAMMTAVKAAGFNTVRIPVTWNAHIGAAPNYTVNAAWMDRVQQVADYVVSTGMYAIINTHHDEWVSLMPTADQAAIADKLAKLWTQIANRFKNYDDHLIFETLNEPRTTDATEWSGGTPAARAILNTYHLAAVNAIRATGGNNALRQIMVPAHGACWWSPCLSDLSIPNNDARIIVSVHVYFPDALSLGTGTAWGTAADKAALTAAIDGVYGVLQQKGRAAVFGEWGTYHKNNTTARVDHAGAYAREVTARGGCPVWWDNGIQTVNALGFALLNRSATPPTWVYPEIMSALIAGANAGSASAP